LETEHQELCPVVEHAEAGYSPMGSCQCALILRLRGKIAASVANYLNEQDIWNDTELVSIIVRGG